MCNMSVTSRDITIKGTCLAALIMALTVVLHLIVGTPTIGIFRAPLNILLLVLWLVGLWLGYRHRRESAVIRYMLSWSATWLSLALMVGVGIYLGLQSSPSGESYPVITALLFVASHITLIILRGWRNALGIRWRFLITHVGLWLLLVAGLYGAPDRHQMRAILYHSTPTNEAFTMQGVATYLDFEMELEDYTMELNSRGVAENMEARLKIDNRDATLRVNHPYNESWHRKIYLIEIAPKSKEQMEYCIVEIIEEPWRWLTLIGIVMLMVGSLLLFLQGPRRGVNKKTTNAV